MEDCAAASAWTADGPLPPGHYLPYALEPQRANQLWSISERLSRPTH